jgi:hypothetical protein
MRSRGGIFNLQYVVLAKAFLPFLSDNWSTFYRYLIQVKSPPV